MKQLIELKVNGETHDLAVEPRQTLLEILREDLGLTGAKETCGMGSCGSCTVILDGRAVLSCLVLAVRAHGKDILTVEGLAEDGKLHPIQGAFVNEGAVQCGYCIPGMIMTAKALLDEKPKPTVEEIKKGLGGNFCRCTGYYKIVKAIQAASQKL